LNLNFIVVVTPTTHTMPTRYYLQQPFNKNRTKHIIYYSIYDN